MNWVKRVDLGNKKAVHVTVKKNIYMVMVGKKLTIDWMESICKKCTVFIYIKSILNIDNVLLVMKFGNTTEPYSMQRHNLPPMYVKQENA